jgi:hypothetical protein
LAVKAAADSLDYPSFEVLLECMRAAEVLHPKRKTTGDTLVAISREAAIQRLLSSGLLQARPYLPSKGDMAEFKDGPASSIIRYEITRLGQSAFNEFTSRFDFTTIQRFVEDSSASN